MKFSIDKWNNLRDPKFEIIKLKSFKKLGIKPKVALVVVNDIVIVSAKRYHHSGVSGTIVAHQAVPL